MKKLRNEYRSIYLLAQYELFIRLCSINLFIKVNLQQKSTHIKFIEKKIICNVAHIKILHKK